MAESRAEEIIREYDEARSSRMTLESHWDEIAQRVLPSYSGLFVGEKDRTEGQKRTEYMFDSTAAVALDRFAAIADSLLTPRNQLWHRLLPSDSALMKSRPVRLWFEEATRTLFKYRYSPRANFSAQNSQSFVSLGAFGTAALFIDALAGEAGLRYRNIHLGEIYFFENHQGLIDKAVRCFRMSARQAAQRWGDKLPPKIKEAADKKPNDQFEFIHCVKPRDEKMPGRLDYRGMDYASYYVAKGEKVVLEEGGFNSFPFAIGRYEQAPGEVYGRSPAMKVLPAIKTLNEEKKIVLKQGHRTVDPVLLAHDDGVLDGFDLRPGAVNYGGMSAEGRKLVDTLPVGNVVVGKELMDDERVVINDAFLVTLFQILVETPTMTATEVLERTREKGILLAPTLGRMQSEYLGPLVEREVDVLVRQGLLPPMPPELVEAGSDYRVEYDSPLSRAQKAEESAGLMRTIEMALNVVNVTQNPAPLDHFNWDVILPEIADNQAVPARWLNSNEQVAAIRESRAQQVETKQVTDALPGVAAMVKADATVKKAGAR